MTFASIIDTLDSFLWGWPLIILLFGTHIFMTIRTGFIQKDIFKAIRLSVTKDPDASVPVISSVSAQRSPWADPVRFCGCGFQAFSVLRPNTRKH